MKTNGEYLFKSFEEALIFAKKPTSFEKDRGIKITGHKIVLDYNTIKFVHMYKSDGQIGLYLFFKNSKLYDVWKFWVPLEEQFDVLQYQLPDFIEKIDKHNSGVYNGKVHSWF